MMNYIKTIYYIFEKDILLELKNKDIISSMLLFSLLIVTIFSFIINPAADYKSEIASGVLWIAIVFSGLLGLNRSIVIETMDETLTALMLAPVDKSAILFGKVLSNTFFMIAMEFMIIPAFTVFYNINIFASSYLSPIIFISCTYGFCLLGTFFSFMASKTKIGEIILPLLLLPILIPLLLAGIQSLSSCITGENLENIYKWIRVIFIFDLIFTVVINAIFEYIVEE